MIKRVVITSALQHKIYSNIIMVCIVKSQMHYAYEANGVQKYVFRINLSEKSIKPDILKIN